MDPDSLTFLNRRVFAYVDTGIPDGVQVDKNGNAYAGCGDGVQVRVYFFYLPFDSSFFSTAFLSHITRDFFWTHSYFFVVLSLYQSVI